MNAFATALANIRRSPYQALSALMIASVTFTVIFLLSYFLYGAELTLRYYESRPQVIAFFEVEADQDSVTAAQQALQNKPYVAAATITTKEQALELYSEVYRNSPLLLELVTADILPASIEVSGTQIDDLAQISEDLKQIEGVEDVVFQDSVINKIASWISTGRVMGGISAAVLTLLSFLVILVIISMRVSMYKNRIAIMRLLGATRWYVRRPYMVEGMIYSTLGALSGWLISFGLMLYFSPDIQAFVADVQIFPIAWELLALQAGVGIVFGMILGGFAGLTAASRLIRQ